MRNKCLRLLDINKILYQVPIHMQFEPVVSNSEALQYLKLTDLDFKLEYLTENNFNKPTLEKIFEYVKGNNHP